MPSLAEVRQCTWGAHRSALASRKTLGRQLKNKGQLIASLLVRESRASSRTGRCVCNGLKVIHSNAEKVSTSGCFDKPVWATLMFRLGPPSIRFSFLKEAIWGVLPPALRLENHSWGFLEEIFLAQLIDLLLESNGGII